MQMAFHTLDDNRETDMKEDVTVTYMIAMLPGLVILNQICYPVCLL